MIKKFQKKLHVADKILYNICKTWDWRSINVSEIRFLPEGTICTAKKNVSISTLQKF